MSSQQRGRCPLAVGLVLLLIIIVTGVAVGQTSTAGVANATVPRLIKFSGVVKTDPGTVGITFALYKDQTGGAPLWLETQNVTVGTDGRYTVLLGANHADGVPLAMFATGEARWLGMQVDGAEENARTLLVSVPYAMAAGDAQTLGGRPLSAFVLSGLKNGTGDDGLNYINTAAITSAVGSLFATTAGAIPKFADGSGTLTNSVLAESNGRIGVGTNTPTFMLDIQNTDTTGAGAQLLNLQTNSTSGARIFFSSTAANGRAYGIGSNFITGQGEFGIYDYTANVPRLVIKNNGFLGVGVSNPGFLLDLATTDTTAAGSQLLQLTTPSVNGAKILFNSTSTNGHTYGFGSNFILGQGEFGIYDYKTNATRLMVDANGNVGIGTTGPGAKLDVAGDLRVSGNLLVPNAVSTAMTFTGANSTAMVNATQQQATGITTVDATHLPPAAVSGTATGASAVVAGVLGTNNTSPDGSGVIGVNKATTPDCPAAPAPCSAAPGVYGVSLSAKNGTGVYGEAKETANTNDAVGFPIGVYGVTQSGIGIGTAGSNNAALGKTTGVWGAVESTGGYGIEGDAYDPNATVNADGTTSGGTANHQGVGVAGYADGDTGRGVVGYALHTTGSTIGVRGNVVSPNGVAGLFENTGGGDIVIGRNAATSTNVFRVGNDGQVFGKAFNTSGADFAESFAVRGVRTQYEPGDLLAIDATGNRRLTLAQEPYSTLVAGIFSTQPGMLASPYPVSEKAKMQNEVPLAVVGVVPCKVTVENGPIQRGDLLVASSKPGYAMKGTDRDRMVGAVVGKALEPLPSGEGVIQVLVTLQ